MAAIQLPAEKRRRMATRIEGLHLVNPGEVITEEEGFMRGHGTILRGGHLVASVSGVVERTNKVVSVRPARSRYVGEIGDVVVGRVTEVNQRRWKVDTNAKLDSVLKLSSVNLPGGVLRRKSAADELMMREFFVEGDIISAEVQQIYQEDGSLALHTRSLKYGKLGAGSFLAVQASLVKRSKNHFHTLPCGVGLVLGNNGYIWVGPPLAEAADVAERGGGGAAPTTAAITPDLRCRIARVRNVIVALASQVLPIFDATIIYAYEDSEAYAIKDLVNPSVAAEITLRAAAHGLGGGGSSEAALA
eukprot:UC1_evm1s1651